MVRTLRLISGLVLFAFVTSHLVNMALGLHSIELADRLQPFLTDPWTGKPASAVLLVMLVLHAALGLKSLYQRNTLRMSGYDQIQLVAGLLVIPLLASHVIGITGSKVLFNYEPSYWDISRFFWLEKPLEGLRQVFIVIVAWIHGAVGMFTWLRLKPWWQNVAWFVYPLVVAVPVLALLGFVQAGNEVIAQSKVSVESVSDEAETTDETALSEEPAADPAEEDTTVRDALALVRRIWWTVMLIYVAALAATLVARFMRLRSREDSKLRISYLNGPTITADAGVTLLELARLEHLPHANLCRGRGRCGTCRVRIIHSSEPLPPAGPIERQTLDRFDAADDVRLACQLAPEKGKIQIERLVSPVTAGRTIDDEGRDNPVTEPVTGN